MCLIHGKMRRAKTPALRAVGTRECQGNDVGAEAEGSEGGLSRSAGLALSDYGKGGPKRRARSPSPPPPAAHRLLSAFRSDPSFCVLQGRLSAYRKDIGQAGLGLYLPLGFRHVLTHHFFKPTAFLGWWCDSSAPPPFLHVSFDTLFSPPAPLPCSLVVWKTSNFSSTCSRTQ